MKRASLHRTISQTRNLRCADWRHGVTASLETCRDRRHFLEYAAKFTNFDSHIAKRSSCRKKRLTQGRDRSRLPHFRFLFARSSSWLPACIKELGSVSEVCASSSSPEESRYWEENEWSSQGPMVNITRTRNAYWYQGTPGSSGRVIAVTHAKRIPMHLELDKCG